MYFNKAKAHREAFENLGNFEYNYDKHDNPIYMEVCGTFENFMGNEYDDIQSTLIESAIDYHKRYLEYIDVLENSIRNDIAIEQNEYNVLTEGFKDSVKKVIEKIKAFFKKVWKWIKVKVGLDKESNGEKLAEKYPDVAAACDDFNRELGASTNLSVKDTTFDAKINKFIQDKAYGIDNTEDSRTVAFIALLYKYISILQKGKISKNDITLDSIEKLRLYLKDKELIIPRENNTDTDWVRKDMSKFVQSSFTREIELPISFVVLPDLSSNITSDISARYDKLVNDMKLFIIDPMDNGFVNIDTIGNTRDYDEFSTQMNNLSEQMRRNRKYYITPFRVYNIYPNMYKLSNSLNQDTVNKAMDKFNSIKDSIKPSFYNEYIKILNIASKLIAGYDEVNRMITNATINSSKMLLDALIQPYESIMNELK